MERETRRFYNALFFPVIFLILAWLVLLVEEVMHLDLGQYGMRPQEWRGLIGLFTSPFLHGGWEHLISNSFPILVLGSSLFYFYKDIFFSLAFWLWFGSGALLWLIGRPGTLHIGASGIVYALAFFLLLSGFLRKNRALLTLSLIVVFLYGYLVWGVFPLEPKVSWEGHLSGLIVGMLLAIFYRKKGPENDPKKVWDDSDLDHVPPYWEVEDESGDAEKKPSESIHPKAKPMRIRYRYIPGKSGGEELKDD